VDKTAEPRFLVIGRITKPHGVRGEMRVVVYTDVPERFEWLETVYLSADEWDDDPLRVVVESVRPHGDLFIIALESYDTRESVDPLRGMWLQVPVAEAVPLEEGEVYLYQLIGLAVESDTGEQLGNVTDVIETGANFVFVINGADGELLIPDIAEVVLSVDVVEKRMIVHLLPGLRPA
jgi:16S rRNA processing protein RimM